MEGLTLVFIVNIIGAGLRTGTPLLFATVGELLTERSGVLNLGVEGMMLVGALAGFAVAFATGNPWLGILAGMLAGGVLSQPPCVGGGNAAWGSGCQWLGFDVCGAGLNGRSRRTLRSNS